MRTAIYSIHIHRPRMPIKLQMAYNASLALKGMYATRIGADLIVKTRKTFFFTGWQSPERLDMHELFQRYDRILYLDADILVKPDAPNIFEVFDDEELHMLNECPNPEKDDSYKTLINETEQNAFTEIRKRDPSFAPPKWYPYFNAGVILCSKKHAGIFQYWPNLYFETHRMEQDYINYLIWLNKVETHCLPIEWNGIILLVKEEDYLSRCHFVHYIGMENRGGREVLYDDFKKLEVL